MRIGVDIRALQTGHRFRGIGEDAKRITNGLMELARKDKANHSFVFYEYDDPIDPKELLSIPQGIEYEVVKQGFMPEGERGLEGWEKVKTNLRLMFSNPIVEARRCDVFLQFDFNFGVPKNVPSVLIKHDFIPYVFWNQYFESPMVPLKNFALRTTLRTIFANYKFSKVMKHAVANAKTVVAISKNTKEDVKKFLGKRAYRKTKVINLGVELESTKTDAGKLNIEITKPYLLFIGAGDQRRRVEDLVDAYNNLRADGHDIQLVLAGENFSSKEGVPVKSVRDSILASSYGYDILMAGYISDEQKWELYKNALAFVYPTLYEGFGIPMLEAMLTRCPVVSYKNSSLIEVGGRFAVYAEDWLGIKRGVIKVMDMPDTVRKNILDSAQSHAQKLNWGATNKKLYRIILNLL